jgi:hypothetical protein
MIYDQDYLEMEEALKASGGKMPSQIDISYFQLLWLNICNVVRIFQTGEDDAPNAYFAKQRSE